MAISSFFFIYIYAPLWAIETWKVVEFCNYVFQAWKVMDFNWGPWKVIEKESILLGDLKK